MPNMKPIITKHNKDTRNKDNSTNDKNSDIQINTNFNSQNCEYNKN